MRVGLIHGLSWIGLADLTTPWLRSTVSSLPVMYDTRLWKMVRQTVKTLVPIETFEDCHLEEPTQREEHLELFHNNDSLSEVRVQDLAIVEESQEEVSSTQLIVTTLIIYDHIYEDSVWSIPPPPTLASFVHVSRAHTSKPSLVGATCRILPYLGKLEDINN
ncbi:hypothetical protein TIFTF001_034170 [Ficus carica]|uniref:Uncharacterized protein n=1 Tax=Ficus carica TaxID=3494 RepID=A0AA88JAA5_FICCA|nr:hypothetical protein TIFTF001_034170 [Ficus carica]